MAEKFVHKENKGSLFKNDKKETESQPDLRGVINVEGKEFWLSGWKNFDDSGKLKRLSLSVQPKQDDDMNQKTEIEDDF